jgi:hypothetical protein
MRLFFLCLAGTTRTGSCQRSFLGTFSATSLSGSTVVALSCPFSSPMTAPTPSCAAAPASSPSESGPGTRSSPSTRSSPARMRTSNQAVCDAAAHCPALALWPSQPPPAAAVHPHPGSCRFQTPWSLYHHARSSQENARKPFFPNPMEGFLHAEGQLLLPSLHSSGTRSDSRDCLLRGQCLGGGEPCGEPGYTPGPNQFQRNGVQHHAVFTLLPAPHGVHLLPVLSSQHYACIYSAMYSVIN